MSVGAELREARERAGLAREDVSQRTKIQLAKLEALESDEFDRLPEGIYLDGLVRAYATAVGLDGSCMVTRMHQQRALGVSAVDPFAESEFVSELEQPLVPPDPVADLHFQPAEPSVANVITHENQIATSPLEVGSVSRLDDVDRADFIVPPAVEESRVVASPAFLSSVQERPRRSVGRFVMPVLLLFAAFALGAFLYDRYRPFGARADELTLAVAHDDESTADRAAANSKTQPIAPDAVPADRPATSEHHADDTTPSSTGAVAIRPDASTSAPTKATPGVAEPPAPGGRSAAAPSGTGEARSESSAPSSPSTPPAPPALPAPPAPVTPASTTNLSGSWTLDTRVESSSVRDFEGLHLGYRLELHQSGDRVTGEGVKLRENGKQIVDYAQTPIVVNGTIEGSRLILTFTERGRRRESGGKMILEVHEDGVLRGRFASSAARSTGLVEARRGQS